MQVADKECPPCPEVETIKNEQGIVFADGRLVCETLVLPGGAEITDSDGTPICVTY